MQDALYGLRNVHLAELHMGLVQVSYASAAVNSASVFLLGVLLDVLLDAARASWSIGINQDATLDGGLRHTIKPFPPAERAT